MLLPSHRTQTCTLESRDASGSREVLGEGNPGVLLKVERLEKIVWLLGIFYKIISRDF